MASLPKELDPALFRHAGAWVAELEASFAQLAREIGKTTSALNALTPHLLEIARWYRFDTVYGPLIGGAVILGSIALAVLAAWMGGVP